MRMMHIAQSAGGVAVYLRTFFQYYPQGQDEQILVVSKDYSLSVFQELVDHIEVVDMRRELNFSADRAAIRQIRQLLKYYHPDLLYLHSSKAGALGRLATLGMKDRPLIIYNPHGWAFNMRVFWGKRWLYRMIERQLAKYCERIVLISDYEKISALSGRVATQDQLCVIENAVEQTPHLPSLSRSSLGIGETDFVVGFVGRLTQQKAPDIFIQAAQLIQEVIPEAYFLIVGDGEDKRHCEALADCLGLSRLQITGWVQAPRAYMRLMDIGTLLSRWEGFGLVAAEYMMEKVPLVASATDALPTLVEHQKTGCLVPPDDPQAVAWQVIELYHAPKKRRQMAEQAYQMAVERFSCSRWMAAHLALFDEVRREDDAAFR